MRSPIGHCAAILLLAAAGCTAPRADPGADAVENLEAYAAYKMGRYHEARERWEALAARGNTTALINLANLYEQGQGVRVDLHRASDYTRAAAEAGDSRAQYQLGMAYERGVGVERDLAEAARWLGQAAAQDDVDAQFALGVLLATGLGAGPRHATATQVGAARDWLTRAEAAGHREAAAYLLALPGPPAGAD